MTTLYDLDPEWPASRKAVLLSLHTLDNGAEITAQGVANALGMSPASVNADLRALADTGHVDRRAFLDASEKKQVAYSLPGAPTTGGLDDEDPPSDD